MFVPDPQLHRCDPGLLQFLDDALQIHALKEVVGYTAELKLALFRFSRLGIPTCDCDCASPRANEGSSIHDGYIVLSDGFDDNASRERQTTPHNGKRKSVGVPIRHYSARGKRYRRVQVV